jgi:hypothetical protein
VLEKGFQAATQMETQKCAQASKNDRKSCLHQQVHNPRAKRLPQQPFSHQWALHAKKTL